MRRIKWTTANPRVRLVGDADTTGHDDTINQALKDLLWRIGFPDDASFSGLPASPVINVSSFAPEGTFAGAGNAEVDTAAWQAAVAAWRADPNKATLYVPDKPFLVQERIDLSLSGETPRVGRIYFEGNASVRLLGSGCFVIDTHDGGGGAHDLGTTHRLLWDGGVIHADMLPAGARAIIIGEVFAGRVTLRDIDIWQAQGTDSIGLSVQNAVGCVYIDVYTGRCDTGIVVGRDADQALPTLQTFIGCSTRECTTKGFRLEQGYQIQWAYGLMEANAEEGLYCVPDGTSNVLDCQFGGWWEFNYTSQATEYQVRIDGSGTSGTVDVSVYNGTFASNARGIYIRKNVGWTIGRIRVANAADQIVVDGDTSQGRFTDWNENNCPFDTVVTNGSPGTVRRPFPANGTALLVAGEVTISHPSVRSSSRIACGRLTIGGTPGTSYIAQYTTGTSFTITSNDAADTSVVWWTNLTS